MALDRESYHIISMDYEIPKTAWIGVAKLIRQHMVETSIVHFSICPFRRNGSHITTVSLFFRSHFQGRLYRDFQNLSCELCGTTDHIGGPKTRVQKKWHKSISNCVIPDFFSCISTAGSNNYSRKITNKFHIFLRHIVPRYGWFIYWWDCTFVPWSHISARFFSSVKSKISSAARLSSSVGTPPGDSFSISNNAYLLL